MDSFTSEVVGSILWIHRCEGLLCLPGELRSQLEDLLLLLDLKTLSSVQICLHISVSVSFDSVKCHRSSAHLVLASGFGPSKSSSRSVLALASFAARSLSPNAPAQILFFSLSSSHHCFLIKLLTILQQHL